MPDEPIEEVEDKSAVAFRRREKLVEAKSIYNAPEVVERAFESDWKRIQRGPDNTQIAAALGLKSHPAWQEEIEAGMRACMWAVDWGAWGCLCHQTYSCLLEMELGSVYGGSCSV